MQVGRHFVSFFWPKSKEVRWAVPEVLDAARRFTESIAAALKGKIRVVSIHPAFVATDMSKCVPAIMPTRSLAACMGRVGYPTPTIIRASGLFTQP